MQIKKFEARTMTKALQMVKAELGSDAVILSTKNLKRGIGSFGILGAPMVEITAALDRSPDINRLSAKGREGSPEGTSLSYDTGEIGALREEVREIKGLLGRMNGPRGAKGNVSTSVPDCFKGIYSEIVAGGVAPQLAMRLIEKGMNGPGRDNLKNYAQRPSLLKETLAMTMMDAVNVAGDIDLGEAKGKAVAFIGPTGVGKTTTIAKLAARYSRRGKDVALITIDTYRIGAVEQFKTYARILKSPVGVATTPREMRERIESFRDRDLILIDTAGRSHKDHSQISFLNEFFPHSEGGPELHLLLSATTKDSDLADIVKRFGRLPVRRHLFTKLDESTSFGSLLNVAVRFRTPYSYFTTGQRVPEDIEVASPERVADLILRISDDMKFDCTAKSYN